MSAVENATMPRIAAPSIAQQRIILVVLSLVIVMLVWWQDAGRTSNYPVHKFAQTPVPEVVEQLDFTTAEAAWSGLHIDSLGNLQIDAVTETALSEAIALMRGQASEVATARMALLLEKQFGATARQQIMQLLLRLKRYKETEQRWWEENGSRNPPPYAELFRLQDEVFGQIVAEKMFAEQRRLANMMLATQQIRNDTNLTQAEKDQALLDLQNNFQAEGAPGE